ncbi:STY4851/ECs_5259 family protein [Vibrio splendidus]|uniref:STY4851/ECs_5259 family protein n=1 Tax=Vibrio splendidus TaxID=29497 RepID=UPI00076A0C57|nr:STY4851/ECs_5259 family protein [Vibrio splendidus]
MPTQSVSDWLKQFCLTRSDKIHSNQPLYQLHMTQSEYRELEVVLSKSRGFQHTLRFTKEWCGAFTLYCAEWFRREYTQNWSWEPIFDRLQFRLSPGDISEAIPMGLEDYWGKTLSRYSQSNRNDYLGSLFREGGLPSNLLSQNDNHYQWTFNSVFDKYQLVREFGDSAVNDYISSKVVYLPESLQGEESIELIRNMVEKLDSFVHTYNLDEQADPVAYLEQNYPQWREVFPLPLDSATGTLFLSQLLSRATEEVRKVANKRRDLRCKHYIDFANQSVISDVLLPLNITFDVNPLQLSSSRIELAIFEGERHLASLGTCFAQFENDKTVVRIRQSLASVVRDSTDSELYIVALQSGRLLAQERLAGSAVDCEETPLTLVPSNGRWFVAGQATARTKVKEALVLVPKSTEYTLQRGSYTHNPSLVFRSFETYTLEGKVSLSFENGDTFVITTGAEHYAEEVFTLKGDLLPWKTIPSLVFKGVPKIATQDVGDIGLGLSTYLNGEVAHRLAPSEVNGRQLLSVKNRDNEVLLRKRIGILPKDFKLELVPGVTPSEGRVLVSSQSPLVAHITNKELQTSVTKPETGITEISLNANGMPPATFTLNIQASLLSEPITLIVPYPSTGVTAFNGNGQPLQRRLSLEDLVGSRINLFTQQGRPTRYEITLLNLSKYSSGRRAASFNWDYRVTDKPVEVSLYGLRDYVFELLSLSENLDSEVELSIKGCGRTERFVISYYSTTVSYDTDNNLVSLNSRTLRDASGVKAILTDLTKPEQTPHALVSRVSEGVDTGEYELPSFLDDGGPWLVLPAENSKVAFRARFIPSDKKDSDVLEINTLQKAARAFNPRDEVTSIAKVVSQMADDWNHSGWTYLQSTWKQFQYLPMSTFEVWRHLVRNPKALAVALFKFDMDAQLIAKLETQLPVVWEFIPIQCWLDAKKLFGDALQKLGVTGEMQADLLGKVIDKLTQEISSLSALAQYLKDEKIAEPFPIQIMQPMIQGQWYQDLLRLHSDNDHWPNDGGNDLRQMCSSLGLMPFDLTVNAGYQTGVVYAPIFAAGVACGRVPQEIISRFEHKMLFDFRQLKNFDHQWFGPLFSYVVNYLTCNAS